MTELDNAEALAKSIQERSIRHQERSTRDLRASDNPYLLKRDLAFIEERSIRLRQSIGRLQAENKSEEE